MITLDALLLVVFSLALKLVYREVQLYHIFPAYRRDLQDY